MKIEISIKGLEPIAEAINKVADAINSRDTLKEIKKGIDKILESPEAMEEEREAYKRAVKEAEPKQNTIKFPKKDYTQPRVVDVADSISARTGKPALIYRKEIRERYKTFTVGKYERMDGRDAYAYRSLFYDPKRTIKEN